MKKLLVLLICLVLAGCAGTTIKPMPQHADLIADATFNALIISQPQLKPVIVEQLNNAKTLLATDLSYNALMADLAQRFAGPYAPVALTLMALIEMDAPISKDWLTMFDGQKVIIATKIDHLLMLAGA